MTDLLDRLRAADPVREPLVPPPVEGLLARLEPTPRPPRGRRLLLEPALAGLLAVAVIVALGQRSSPDVVAEAREALGAPGEIVHYVIRGQRIQPNGEVLGEGSFKEGKRTIGELTGRTEKWVALDPLRQRTRTTIAPRGGGPELWLDNEYADGVSRSANSWDAALRVLEMKPEWREDFEQRSVDPVTDVRAMLGDGRLKPAGETVFKGRRVLRLLGQRPERITGSARSMGQDIEYLVDARTFEPVRTTMRGFMTFEGRKTRAGTTLIDFESYETLPPTPENLALLRIPDADQRRVVAR